MKPSPKRAKRSSKNATGENAGVKGQVCAFLDSPDDPYYLPSDAENAQVQWTRGSQEGNAQHMEDLHTDSDQEQPANTFARQSTEKASKPYSKQTSMQKPPVALKSKQSPQKPGKSPRKRKQPPAEAAAPALDLSKILSLKKGADRPVRSPKKASKARNKIVDSQTNGDQAGDGAVRPRKLAKKEDVCYISASSREASPGSAAAEEIKSTIAETAQNTPVVASSQIAEEVKLPKEAVRGFSRANLQVRSQAEALEGGKGGALVVLPDTVKDDNHISCSPAMSEALNEIAMELPSGKQSAASSKTKTDDGLTASNPAVIDLTGEESGKSAARGKKISAAGTSSQPAGAASTQLPGKRNAAKGRQPSRLAKESRPDSSDPHQAPPPALKVSPRKTKVTFAPQTKAKEATNGLRTPLLLRNALSSGLARVWSGRGLSTPAPAVTVMEAQESGELRQIQDSMLYALDGLDPSASVSTQRDSASTLLDICATRKGRLAFLSDGLFLDAISSAQQLLTKSWDSDVAAMFAANFLCCCKEAAGQAAIASKQGIAFLCFLLKRGFQAHQSESCVNVTAKTSERLSKLIGDKVLDDSANIGAAISPVALAALTIINGTEPQHTTASTEALKGGLREHGALHQLATCVAEIGSNHTAERLWWLLHLLLVALENCTFACPENEQYLVKLSIAYEGKSLGFAENLVHFIDSLESKCTDVVDDTSKRKDCLFCALSVIMNLTQQNDAACNLVIQAGILPIAARLLANLARKCQHSSHAAAEGIAVISATLGLLINIAEARSESMQSLLHSQQADGSTFTSLLCSFIEDSWLPGGISKASGAEVTAEDISLHEEEGRAAVIQVYASLLAGFLISSNPALQQEMAHGLSAGSIQPVVDGVQRCLEFYLSTGAITERTETSLKALLATLTAV